MPPPYRITYKTREPGQPWKLWTKVIGLELDEWYDVFRSVTKAVPGLQFRFVAQVEV